MRSVFMGETLYALQFDYEDVFNENVGIIFPNILTLVMNSDRCLRRGLDVAQPEFLE